MGDLPAARALNSLRQLACQGSSRRATMGPLHPTIGMMGQYSYLRFARPAGVGETEVESNDMINDDTSDEYANE